MAKVLLPLCSNLPAVTRDGYSGQFARLNLPFFGYWFASGAQITTLNTAGNIQQDRSYTVNGRIKPDVFNKGAGCCGNGL